MRRHGWAIALTLAAAGPAQAQTGTSSATVDHVRRLEALNARIDALESQIADADAQVDLLQDSAISGQVGRTHAVILHRNRLGSAYRIRELRYVLDGKTVYESTENEEGSRVKTVPLYAGFMEEGAHLIEVQAVLEFGSFGIFSYVENYKFRVDSRYVLQVREGRVNRLEVVFLQKPDISLPAEERLAVRYDLSLEAGLPVGGKKLAGQPPAGDTGD